jgi:hypothetical protein
MGYMYKPLPRRHSQSVNSVLYTFPFSVEELFGTQMIHLPLPIFKLNSLLFRLPGTPSLDFLTKSSAVIADPDAVLYRGRYLGAVGCQN